MTRPQLVFVTMAVLLGGTAVFVSAQRPTPPVRRVEYPYWEAKALAPREVKPAQYVQVSQRDIDSLGAEGWELVSVAPFVMSNEARGPGRDTVTQVYSAYHFKRIRPDR